MPIKKRKSSKLTQAEAKVVQALAAKSAAKAPPLGAANRYVGEKPLSRAALERELKVLRETVASRARRPVPQPPVGTPAAGTDPSALAIAAARSYGSQQLKSAEARAASWRSLYLRSMNFHKEALALMAQEELVLPQPDEGALDALARRHSQN